MIKLENTALQQMSKEKSPTRCTGWKNYGCVCLLAYPHPGPSRGRVKRRGRGRVKAQVAMATVLPRRRSDLADSTELEHVASAASGSGESDRARACRPRRRGWWCHLRSVLCFYLRSSSSSSLSDFVATLPLQIVDFEFWGQMSRGRIDPCLPLARAVQRLAPTGATRCIHRACPRWEARIERFSLAWLGSPFCISGARLKRLHRQEVASTNAGQA